MRRRAGRRQSRGIGVLLIALGLAFAAFVLAASADRVKDFWNNRRLMQRKSYRTLEKTPADVYKKMREKMEK